MTETTPAWGSSPFPSACACSARSTRSSLWTNLGISLLVLVAASYLGLSLKQALLATLVGGLIGNTMLGVAALIGADARVPTMALQRAPLGQRGSYLATGLNVLQCLGWSVFEITVIAIAAGALSRAALRRPPDLDVEARASARSGSCSRCSGPSASSAATSARSASGRSRRRSSISPCGSSQHGHVGNALARRRARRLVLARRRPRDRAHRVVGAARRRLHALLAAAAGRRSSARGSATCCRRSSSSASARSSSSRIRRSPGRRTCSRRSRRAESARVLALLALTVDETDEAFANIYSTAVSLQNFSRARRSGC